MNVRILRAAIAALGIATTFVAHAGDMSPCDRPTVFEHASVQVFVLPYQATGRLTAQGRALATIAQRHVLFAALKYPSIGIIELTGDGKDCTYQRIAQRVTGRLRKGQTAIFMWGRMFEQGDTIRLQSTVAFTKQGSVDTLEWDLGGGAGAASASVPTTPIMFAPRQIPKNLLPMLEPAQRAARRLHREPNTSSPYFDLPGDPEARFSYEVLEARDDWMHIRLLPSKDQGWVPAHALLSGDDLKGTFPELYFVDALIGYHQLWREPALSAAAQRRVLASTRASLDKYLQEASGRAESDAHALAMVLKGNATLRAAGHDAWSTSVLQEAQAHYRKAQELAPASTVASNFYLACSSALCARGACAEGSDAVHRQYLEAIGRDPTSAELVGNLGTFYSAAQSGSIRVSAPPEEIARQKEQAREVQSKLE
jgi:hypothetical protein